MKTENGGEVDLGRLFEDIKTVVRDGQELLRAGASGVKERAMAGAETTERAAREHPYRTVGFAFGLGVLVGALAVNWLARGGESEESRE